MAKPTWEPFVQRESIWTGQKMHRQIQKQKEWTGARKMVTGTITQQTWDTDKLVEWSKAKHNAVSQEGLHGKILLEVCTQNPFVVNCKARWGCHEYLREQSLPSFPGNPWQHWTILGRRERFCLHTSPSSRWGLILVLIILWSQKTWRLCLNQGLPGQWRIRSHKHLKFSPIPREFEANN